MEKSLVQINGVIDVNDISHVKRLGLNPISGRPAPDNKGKCNPHLSELYLEDGRTVSVFHVKPIYYLHWNGTWRPMRELASHHGHRRLNLYPDWDTKVDLRYLRWLMKRMELIGGSVNIPFTVKNEQRIIALKEPETIVFTTDTFYPDPDAETSSVDGSVKYEAGDKTWVNARAATSGAAYPSIASDRVAGWHWPSVAPNIESFDRAYLLFDTSSIPDADIIDSATLSVYVVERNDQFSESTGVVGATPASNTNLVAADWATSNFAMSTRFATDIAISAQTTNAYTDFSFNASGKAAVSKTGVSKFGLCCARDIDNVGEPTFSSNNGTRYSINFAESASTTTDPKLVVVHSAASVVFSRPNLLLMGVG